MYLQLPLDDDNMTMCCQTRIALVIELLGNAH